MPFGDSIFGNTNCPTGQHYSLTLQTCVPDTTGTHNSDGVDVPINAGDGANSRGGFFSGENISGWASAFATVFNSIKGQPTKETVIVQQPSSEGGNGGNTTGVFVAIAIGVIALVLLLILLLRKRK